MHVWFEDSVQSPGGAPVLEEPDHLPRPRLVGCKVTGDPNVPANQWTWEAQVRGSLGSTAVLVKWLRELQAWSADQTKGEAYSDLHINFSE